MSRQPLLFRTLCTTELNFAMLSPGLDWCADCRLLRAALCRQRSHAMRRTCVRTRHTPSNILENSLEVEHNNSQNILVDIISRLHVFYLAIFQKDRKKKIWHCYDMSGDIPEKHRKNWLWNWLFVLIIHVHPYVFMRVFTDVKVNDLSMCRPKGVAPYQISTTSCLTKMQLLQDCSYPLHCMLAQSKNLQINLKG